MLSLETLDTWTSATFAVTSNAIGPLTYHFSGSSAYDEMEAFKAWFLANFGGATVTWTWVRDTFDLYGGARLRLIFTGPTTLTPNAQATALLGFVALFSTSHLAGANAVGTWAPKSRIAVGKHYKFLDGQGDASATGAIRPGSGATAAYKPEVEAAGTDSDAARITYILGRASNPRRGWIWQVSTSTWLHLAIGQASRSTLDATLYKFNLDCGAVAL